MAQEPVVIPEKLYFKIGEVCDLVGVEAHVLRYWETEFSMLSPQKNKSGQRSYRRKDVEMALRVKQLLYNEMFTIAGARKKLQSEQRDASKPKTNAPINESQVSAESAEAPTLFDNSVSNQVDTSGVSYSGNQHDALKTIAANLLEIRDILKTSRV